MVTLTIHEDINIAAFASAEEAAQAGDATATKFDSAAALAKISAEWPLGRFVVLEQHPRQHGGEEGLGPQAGCSADRIWKAIQPLAGNAQPSEPETKPKKPAKGAERAKKAGGPPRYNATSSPFLRPHRGLRSSLAARNILDIACFRNILAYISKKAAPVAGRGGNWLLLRLRYLRCGTSARLPTRRFPDLGQRHSLGALHRRDHLRYGGPSGISNPMEWNGKAHGSTVEPARRSREHLVGHR